MEKLVSNSQYVLWTDFKNEQQIEVIEEDRLVVTDGWVTDYPVFYKNGNQLYGMDNPEQWSKEIHNVLNIYALHFRDNLKED